MRLQGIVQKVQGCPECRVSDRPAVSFHRGRHLYNELGAFRLFRRVAESRGLGDVYKRQIFILPPTSHPSSSYATGWAGTIP